VTSDHPVLSPPGVVEVFADLSCPYAHVGIRRFIRRRWAAHRDDLALRVRAWPLELVNGAPLDGAHVAEQIADLRAQVAPDLFSGFDPQRFPHTTLPALDLVTDAYAVGMRIGERASIALRDALFERGEDISDPEILERLRSSLGVEPRGPDARWQVLAEWAEGSRRGVVGSPHFFVGEDDFFCPALQIIRRDGGRDIRVDPQRFDEFFARCLAA